MVVETLAGLEALCAELAARRMTADEIRRLEEVHHAIGEAASGGDAETHADWNLAFHRLVIEASHNVYLADQTNALCLRLQPYRKWVRQARDHVMAATVKPGGGADHDVARVERHLQNGAGELSEPLSLTAWTVPSVPTSTPETVLAALPFTTGPVADRVLAHWRSVGAWRFRR
ncbi:FCD domain-containing protein [Amorphus orientalis]|uniref:GntR C-terminal domain-containing protein n=1 Tax=Amorphus orientalis TaxID=649198 RepID=A0AAE3VN46_9HYPH|nr:FCD domain-containing protein [Amorphus orientalis]MDQ0314973.1 hypothetical protein [Amorphus orientalis]